MMPNGKARGGARRVTGRLSHVRESKERHGFRSSKMNPCFPIFIVSPPVYEHTAFLDDFFWRSFPYTQAEATRVFRTRGESSPIAPAIPLVCVLKSAQASRQRVPDPRRSVWSYLEMKDSLCQAFLRPILPSTEK